METTTVRRSFEVKMIGLTILAYMATSFFVQAMSHFVINASHYASISIMRAEPIMPLGILAMVIQGAILGFLFSRVKLSGSVMQNALIFSLTMGLFLAIYIAIVEPSKYTVPSVTSWILVEGIASTIQFTIFGFLLGLIFRNKSNN